MADIVIVSVFEMDDGVTAKGAVADITDVSGDNDNLLVGKQLGRESVNLIKG